MDFSLPERSSRDVPVSQSQAHFIPIYEISAKARSTKKTTDRRSLEKLMRIRHDCPSKEERRSESVCLFEEKKKNCHYKNNQGGFPLLLWQKGTCSQWFSLLRNRCFCLEGAPNNFPVRFGSWVLSSFLSFFNAIVLFSCKIVLVGGGENSPENVIIKYGEFLMSVLAGKNVTYASLIWKGMQDGLLGQISLSDEL